MHADCRRSEGIVWREDQSAPILAIVIWGILGARDDVMPLEDVGVGGMSLDVRGWIFCDRLVLARQALVSSLAGHCDGVAGAATSVGGMRQSKSTAPSLCVSESETVTATLAV